MFERFRNWYLDNYTEITWFLIGFLVMDALVQFGRGNWSGVIISLGLAILNYMFAKRN